MKVFGLGLPELLFLLVVVVVIIVVVRRKNSNKPKNPSIDQSDSAQLGTVNQSTTVPSTLPPESQVLSANVPYDPNCARCGSSNLQNGVCLSCGWVAKD
jgi:hypothetical protein